ncbi:hypothetical protein Lalb_Chr03g0036691 [Lupinus albus]|uniref:Uncharacterized protein n=1 Tax=Lupinus albus TaxID=3870 RepID=A0A6A4QXC2_LUPAL|nr:hypothetical protein Lalb_Chr03g0036691 [Lupinus albus]
MLGRVYEFLLVTVIFLRLAAEESGKGLLFRLFEVFSAEFCLLVNKHLLC